MVKKVISKKTPRKTSKKNVSKWKKILNWLDENLLFYLTLLLVIFIPLYPKIPLADIIPGYIVRVRFEDVLVLFTGIIWLIQVWRKKVTWHSPLFKWIAIYTAIGFFSILSAVFIIQTVPPEALHVGKSVLHFLRYMEYFFLFVLVYSSIKSLKQMKTLLWVLTLTVVGIAIYGAGQKYLFWPVYSTMNREFSKGLRLYLTEHARVQSTFGGHYDLGAYLVVTLPIILAFAYQIKHKWQRRWFKLAHFLGLWLLIMSASRAPFIAYSGAAILVISLISFQEKTWLKKIWSFIKKSLGLGITIGFLLLLFGKDISERFSQVAEAYPKVIAVYYEVNAGRKRVRDNFLDYLSSIGIGPPRGSVGFDNSNLDPVLTPTDQLPTTRRPSDVYKDIPDLIKIETQSADGRTIITTVEIDRVWSENALKYGLSMGIRLDTLWPNAIKGFMRNPLLGTGYATLNKDGAYHFTEAESTDNNFLRVIGETGALGFIAFFGMIGFVMISSFKRFSSKNTFTRTMAVGLFATSAGLLLNALYIDVYASSKVAFGYWIVVGLGFASFALPKDEVEKPVKNKKLQFKQTKSKTK